MAILDDETNEVQCPAQFQSMNNEFEVALWVAQHPRILNLAKEIQDAKSTPITTNEEFQILTTTLHPTISNSTMSPEIDQVIYLQ